jgi:hypothetical protein
MPKYGPPTAKPSSSGATFKAGGNIIGAFATGTKSKASATFIATVPDQTVDIVEALEALHAELARIPNIEPKALTSLIKAKEEAAKTHAVAHAEVTSLVEQAVKYAGAAAGFAGAVEQLAPRVKRIWDWAGATLPDWASTLGLS